MGVYYAGLRALGLGACTSVSPESPLTALTILLCSTQKYCAPYFRWHTSYPSNFVAENVLARSERDPSIDAKILHLCSKFEPWSSCWRKREASVRQAWLSELGLKMYNDPVWSLSGVELERPALSASSAGDGGLDYPRNPCRPHFVSSARKRWRGLFTRTLAVVPEPIDYPHIDAQLSPKFRPQKTASTPKRHGV